MFKKVEKTLQIFIHLVIKLLFKSKENSEKQKIEFNLLVFVTMCKKLIGERKAYGKAFNEARSLNSRWCGFLDLSIFSTSIV